MSSSERIPGAFSFLGKLGFYALAQEIGQSRVDTKLQIGEFGKEYITTGGSVLEKKSSEATSNV